MLKVHVSVYLLLRYETISTLVTFQHDVTCFTFSLEELFNPSCTAKPIEISSTCLTEGEIVSFQHAASPATYHGFINSVKL